MRASGALLVVSVLAPVVAWVLALASSGNAAVLYASDFTRLPDGPAQLTDWSLDGATYQVDKGWLTVHSAQSNPYALLKAKHDGDATLRATVRSAQENHWCALLARGVYRLEVNNQFVHLALLRRVGTDWKLVGSVGGYTAYAHNTQQYELRLVVAGRKVCGFIDDRKLLEYDDPESPPAGGDYALMSGWGTNLAWRDVSLSDQPDLNQWPVETPPKLAPKGLVEVTWARGVSPDSLYFDGQTAGLRFKLRNPGAEARQLALAYRLSDVWQQAVDEKTETVSFQPGEEREFRVDFAPRRRGCFKVALYAGRPAGELGWVEDLGSFTVVAKRLYDAPRNPKSYFGGHMDGINLEWHLQVGRKLGIQWARCHNMLQQTWWKRLQPEGPGEWRWMDDTQQTVDRLGFFTLGQFLWTPKWATSAAAGSPGNPETYPPRNWDDFAGYVYNTVSHYRASIHHWEVWNEPHFNGFWSGTPEEYAKLMGIAYREAKRADPACTIIGGGGTWVRGMKWITSTLDATTSQAMDGYSIHYLEPDIADERMPLLRRALEQHGVTGPVWNTEEQVNSTSFFDQLRSGVMEPEARYHFRNACFELVRCYMENLANGIERIFYYEQADPWRFQEFPKARTEQPYGPMYGGMWDECRMLKPIAAAHAALALAIEGKTYRSRLDPEPLHVFFFEGPEGATAVQYATFPTFARREALRLALPRGLRPTDFTVIDVMGNESAPRAEGGRIVLLLAREPVYLVGKGRRAGEVLRGMYEAAR